MDISGKIPPKSIYEKVKPVKINIPIYITACLPKLSAMKYRFVKFLMVHIYRSGKKEPNQNEMQITWINTKSCEKMPWDREWPTTTNEINIKMAPTMLKALKTNGGK